MFDYKGFNLEDVDIHLNMKESEKKVKQLQVSADMIVKHDEDFYAYLLYIHFNFNHDKYIVYQLGDKGTDKEIEKRAKYLQQLI